MPERLLNYILQAERGCRSAIKRLWSRMMNESPGQTTDGSGSNRKQKRKEGVQ